MRVEAGSPGHGPPTGAALLLPTPLPPEDRSGAYSVVVAAGREMLADELAGRATALGAYVHRLESRRTDAFHWGSWFATQAEPALRHHAAIAYAGAGAVPLLADEGLARLIQPAAGEVVANNRFSADALSVAGDLPAALAALRGAPTDNAAVRCLADAGFSVTDLSGEPYAAFDVDTPQDLALLHAALPLPGTRRPGRPLVEFLEAARLPDGRPLAIPRIEEVQAVMRDRAGELLVAGRVPSRTWQHLETETACRVRLFAEERGMRSAPGGAPRSLFGEWTKRHGPADLMGELTRLADAVVLDTRVLMAALSGSSDAAAWPPAEERYASDFLDAAAISTPWLHELTAAAAASAVPVILGGHALVSDGLRILVDSAWLGH